MKGWKSDYMNYTKHVRTLLHYQYIKGDEPEELDLVFFVAA